MHRRSWTLAIAVAVLPWSVAGAADPKAAEALEAAAKALGATELKSLEFSGSGTSFALGQGGKVDAPWPRFNDKSYQRTVSFEPWGSKLQRVRTQGENPPRGGGGQPIIGEQNQTQVVAPGSAPAAALPDELALSLPQGFIKAALAAPDAAAKREARGGKQYTVVQFTAGNKAITRGWINAQSLLERVQTTVDNAVLGDTAYEAVFSGYQDFGGVKFPSRIQQTQGGYAVLDLNVTAVKANVPVEFAAASAPPPQTLASEKLADGIHLITGGYAAVVVDFKDHITVIEGGQNDQRSEAVIAEAKRLIPGKSITELVNTHAHFDHLGGVRAYVAEGATIVTHRDNPGYFRKLWKNAHTLVPDRLAKNPRAPKFRTVDDQLTLTDGEKVVELYRLKDFGHHDGMLVAYLPQQKILVEADAFNPAPAALTQTPPVINPYHQSLFTNIEQRGLDVQRIIPVHLPADNRTITLAELKTAVGKQ